MKDYMRYDPAAFEHYPPVDPMLVQWDRFEVLQELRARAQMEKDKKELQVYFYRIGYSLSYPLPLRQLPANMPKGIPHLAEYPWNVWLLWTLRERWDTLLEAWKRDGDREAWLLVQQELATTLHWDNISGITKQAQLCTGHLASYLAYALAQPDWEIQYKTETRNSAKLLLERDLLPYVASVWPPDQPIRLQDLHNIKLIILIATAHLCDSLQHPLASQLADQALEALSIWSTGVSQSYYSEGIAYEGFWLEPLLQWLSQSGQIERLTEENWACLVRFAHSCLQLSIPGRLDLQAPLGDNEAEMVFWINVVMHVAHWTNDPASSWLALHLPPARMLASALSLRLQLEDSEKGAAILRTAGISSEPPLPLASEHPQAYTLRTGWKESDLLAAVSASRYPQHHLHADSGHLIIGAQGRCWITDAGYQQYRNGLEREFTLGDHAHNIPSIAGTLPSSYQSHIINQTSESVELLLDQAYDLPYIQFTRTVKLLPASRESEWIIQVHDHMFNQESECPITYAWLGGTHLSWSFCNGWARLSDGLHALWIGHMHQQKLVAISAEQLIRHEGSRGSLTLLHKGNLAHGANRLDWIFYWQADGSWSPPEWQEPFNP